MCVSHFVHDTEREGHLKIKHPVYDTNMVHADLCCRNDEAPHITSRLSQKYCTQFRIPRLGSISPLSYELPYSIWLPLMLSKQQIPSPDPSSILYALCKSVELQPFRQITHPADALSQKNKPYQYWSSPRCGLNNLHHYVTLWLLSAGG